MSYLRVISGEKVWPDKHHKEAQYLVLFRAVLIHLEVHYYENEQNNILIMLKNNKSKLKRNIYDPLWLNVWGFTVGHESALLQL